MAKSKNSKRAAATSSAAALAAAMLGAPVAAAPAASSPDQARQAATPATTDTARRSIVPKVTSAYTVKYKGEYAIAGQSGPHVVFEDMRGNLFTIDPATGDQKFVSRDMPIKGERRSRDGKHFGQVRIVGTDDHGRLVMSNRKGETFHLDPATGDYKFSDAMVSSKTR